MSTTVLVTGAAGFIGRVLLERLLREGFCGKVVDRIVAVDLSLLDLPQDARIHRIEGSIADAGVLEQALAEPVQGVFHLASVPGGAAERDPDLGRRVNLDSTQRLLDLLRTQGNVPRLVFASTIAVYGDPLPTQVDEDTAVAPALSYGAHKLACEILIADASRRGWVRGCSLRLPGVVARPGDGAGLISAFMSQLFWKLRAGEPIVLPVTAEGTAWWISAGACVDNLLHAADVDVGRLGPRCVVQMPALHLAMADVVEALARAYGADRRSFVGYESQPMVQRLFASYPPLSTPRAHALGFHHDGSADALVRRATES
jgi:nucleoside-diphosphate-sugar epimerase